MKPSKEQTRSALRYAGVASLSTTELLSMLVRSNAAPYSTLSIAEQLISSFGGLRGLSQATCEEIAKQSGIGAVTATDIIAAFELGRRLAALPAEETPTVRSPRDVFNLLAPALRDSKKEHLICLCLDTKHRVIKQETVSVGILDSSLVHPREVFKCAIACSAADIILAHNHPSGDPAPSPEDKSVTRRIVEAGRLIGIDLLDHIIIGYNRFVSLKDQGAL